jgi:hypothetical protein
MNNFEFLKQVDKNLYEIISEAEKLYRDEYFEQSITQTRRFAENVCKNVLGDRRTCEKTFDDMLATLKDKTGKAEQEKEFIDDLYFLKREGNNSVHASTVKKDGIVALECMQRAFEVAINYAVYYKKANSKLLKLRYDTELLVTGKKSKKTLAEKFEAEKTKKAKKGKFEEKTKTKKFKKKPLNKNYKGFSNFWKIVIFFGIISFFLILMIVILAWV